MLSPVVKDVLLVAVVAGAGYLLYKAYQANSASTANTQSNLNQALPTNPPSSLGTSLDQLGNSVIQQGFQSLGQSFDNSGGGATDFGPSDD